MEEAQIERMHLSTNHWKEGLHTQNIYGETSYTYRV